MYGKIFASMFKGSLYGQWEAIVTFTAMIVLADQDGEVDMTPGALSAATSIPLDIIQRGIAHLESPDAESRTPDEDGRRIVRVSDTRNWGWQITNHAHYRTMRTAEERREYFKQHKRKQRAKCPPVSTTSPQSPPIAVSSKQRQKQPPTAPVGFAACWERYPKRSGNNPRASAERAYAARLAEGATPDALLAGTSRYARFCDGAGKTGSEYVLMGATFFGRDAHWQEPWDAPSAASGPAPYKPDPFCKVCGMGLGKRQESDTRLTILHKPECPNIGA